MKILPKTKTGWWSIGLIVAMPILFIFGRTLMDNYYPEVAAGNSVIEDLILRPGLAISMLVGLGSGVAAFIVGLVSLIRNQERAILVYLSTLMGGIFFLLLIAEFTFME